MSTALESLLEVAKAFATEIELDPLLSVIARSAVEVMGAELASIFVHDEQAGVLVNRVSDQERGSIVVPIGVGIAGQVAETRTLLNVSDAYADARFNPAFDRQTGFRTRSILAAPLCASDGALMGVIQVLNKREGGGFTVADEVLLTAFAAHAGVALERARLVEAALEQKQIEASLRLAHEIQMGMLPRHFPHPERFDVAATLRPARSVGGDLYDVFEQAGRLWFAVGDVSGKGVAAALFMAVTKTLFRACAAGESSPASVLARVNRELCRDNEQAMFVTLLAGCLDPATGELTLANGGHEPALLLRPGGVEAVGGGIGTVLGVLDDAHLGSCRLRLAPGERLLLFTDGITEAMDAREQEYTGDRLEARVAGAPEGSSQALVDHVLADVEAHVGTAPQSDDLTLMVLALVK